MKNKAVWFFAFLAVLAVALAGIYLWVDRDRDENFVNVAVAQQKDLVQVIAMPGTVKADGVYKVSAEIAAPVKSVLVNEWDYVKKGQLLAELDVRDYFLELESREINLKLAEAKLNLAKAGARVEEINKIKISLEKARISKEQLKRDLSRMEKLYEAGAVPAVEVEKLRTEVAKMQKKVEKLENDLKLVEQGARLEEIQMLELKVEQARVKVEEVKQRLKKAKIYSPVAGYVLSKDIEEGQVITKGKPIFEILSEESLKNLMVEVEVAESYIWGIEHGQEVIVRSDIFRGKEYKGKVDRLAVAAKEGLLPGEENHYIVSIELLNVDEDEKILPGMSVEVVFELKSVDAVVVPLDAVVEDAVTGKVTVWVVDEEGRVEERDVKIGLMNEKEVEIISGLEVGERVILSPSIYLKDGDYVKVNQSE